MISLEDCIGMCGLDENEVAAISEHEHIPEIFGPTNWPEKNVGELRSEKAAQES
jgi:hypothetical protein